MPDLPVDGDGVCMACRAAVLPKVELLRCSTCATPWHSPCLSKPPALSEAVEWSCPDCSRDGNPALAAPRASVELVAAIRAIEANQDLSDLEKARRRQELLAGSKLPTADDDGDEDDAAGNDILEIIGRNFRCVFCMKLPDRPVTTPCAHTFCLKCFQKWTRSGHKTCTKCGQEIRHKMAEQPRINSAIVEAIRAAKISKDTNSTGSAAPYHYILNYDRPNKAFKTERAKRAGKANASSGQIFLTIAPDHFGPILAQHDPKRNIGVRVGDTWGDRLECRQWGAHFPHIAGIAGQSTYGAQSVVLSGGYADDEDHGEWFLYTGSGGRDLSMNKRTNKEQSSDQQFENKNAALRISCLMGYPVRVVRSHKEPSSYAPIYGLWYDGIYRIEGCWRKVGIQGKFKVCRYLFVRCDNEPAPWTSDDHGDRPRPLPELEELKDATEITERMGRPSWDYDEHEGWKWMVPPPTGKKPVLSTEPRTGKQVRRVRKCVQISGAEMLLKGFGCTICNNVIKDPVTTPCGHNFCKRCLMGAYDCQSSTRERCRGGRTLRAQKIVKKCPSCPTDICDFLVNPQINREIMDVIQSLQEKAIEEGDSKENDRAMDKEEDIISLNEIKEEVNADNNETQCPSDDLVNADADPVKVKVENKEQSHDHNTLEAYAEQGNNDTKMEMTATGEVDVQVEYKVLVDPKEDANEEIQRPRKRKADTEIEPHGAKRMKTSDATEEISLTPVEYTMMSSEADGNIDGSPNTSNDQSADEWLLYL